MKAEGADAGPWTVRCLQPESAKRARGLGCGPLACVRMFLFQARQPISGRQCLRDGRACGSFNASLRQSTPASRQRSTALDSARQHSTALDRTRRRLQALLVARRATPGQVVPGARPSSASSGCNLSPSPNGASDQGGAERTGVVNWAWSLAGGCRPPSRFKCTRFFAELGCRRRWRWLTSAAEYMSHVLPLRPHAPSRRRAFLPSSTLTFLSSRPIHSFRAPSLGTSLAH